MTMDEANDPAFVEKRNTKRGRSPYGRHVRATVDKAKPHVLGFSGEEVRNRLKQYDRTPFIELLAGWLECMPDHESIRAFAERAPDKYVNSLVQIAKISGFTEKNETEMNVNFAIGKMSDSQIEDRLREVTGKLGLPMPKMPDVIDVSPEVIDARETAKPDGQID